MSPDIKPGQVWNWKPGSRVPKANREFLIDIGTWTHGRAPVIFPDGGRSEYLPNAILNGCVLVKDADVTPAPLDPSKVKAGDTVTLEKATAKHIDIVERIAHLTTVEDGDRSLYWEIVTRSLGMVYTVGPEHWTLTDHQPAPEPEPEWKQGAVYTAVQKRPGPDHAERYWSTYSSEDGVMLVNDVGSEFEPHELDDVRPLVVIDPATGWWAEIHNALVAAGIGDAGSAATIALATLGIEAP